jgi:hypothetical protein
MAQLLRSRSRRGDAEILTFQPQGMAGRIEAYAHDDGGVTLSRFDYNNDEVARLSFLREDWDMLARFIEEAR